MHSGAPSMIALAEAYPELTMDGNFRALQAELSDTETRIALARGHYNDITTSHNIRVQQLPDALVAKLAGLRFRPLLQLRGFDMKVPTIEFAE